MALVFIQEKFINLCYVYHNFNFNKDGSIGSQWIKISSFFVFKTYIVKEQF